MAAKFEPSDELRKEMVEWYEEHKTYISVANKFGMSSAVASRIIKEYYAGKGNKANLFKYDGEDPEELDQPLSKAAFYYDMMNFAKGYLNGTLQSNSSEQ